MANKYKVIGISFSGMEDLLEMAKARARRQRRSFSNYVTGLIEEDLKSVGVVIDHAAALNEKTTAAYAKHGAAKLLPSAEAADSKDQPIDKAVLPSEKTDVPGVSYRKRRAGRRTPPGPVLK